MFVKIVEEKDPRSAGFGVGRHSAWTERRHLRHERVACQSRVTRREFWLAGHPGMALQSGFGF